MLCVEHSADGPDTAKQKKSSKHRFPFVSSNLIKVILEEEETLISNHRKHIDDIVDIVKQDMGILQTVEEPQSDIEEYVDKLDGILMKKMERILTIRSKLANFYKHLKKEESLQKLYTTKLNETGQDHQTIMQ